MRINITILSFILSTVLFANVDIQKTITARPQPKTYSAKVLTTISGETIMSSQKNQSSIYIKNDNFRTDTDLPTSFVTISTGDKAWVIDHTGMATEIEKEKASLNKKNPIEILSAFNFTASNTQNNLALFIGTPKSSNAQEMFSTKHFSKINVSLNPERNTIEEIKIYNKANKLVTQFNFTYTKVQEYWMSKTVVTKVFIGNQPLTITQTYTAICLDDIPDAMFDIPRIKQSQGGN